MPSVNKKSGLGKTLNRAQKVIAKQRSVRRSARHNIEEPINPNPQTNLRSVTDQTNLSGFLEEAELAGRTFATEKRNLTVLEEETENTQNTPAKPQQYPEVAYDVSHCLRIPRRPKWTEETTPEELDEMEKRNFLHWRKIVAQVQESNNIVMTPFEKNIEVWRQLWRVIERSDVVVQILDSRNPLLYLCDDLIQYVNESGTKFNMVLLNKADFLTLEQRRYWSDYFKKREIRSLFFSAKAENLKNEQKKELEDMEKDDQALADMIQSNLNVDNDKCSDKDCLVLDKYQLIEVFREHLERTSKFNENKHEESTPICNDLTKQHVPTVGLVGYPNVGKSSTINALLSAKKVAVSATPGKTKHFQTFLIDKDLLLCDCPGLVFPNFISSRAEMVINGVLPIDQMKDYVSPVRLIVDRIPRGFFEEIYGLAFVQDEKQNLTADDLLNAYGFMRGYMTARGLPDISRAARKICKDYLDGKILYCESPPGVDKKQYHSYSKLAEVLKRIEMRSKDPKLALKITERQRRLMAQAKGAGLTSVEFNTQYFLPNLTQAHIKGLPNIGNFTTPLGKTLEVKLPKREKKHKKREKLRRVYRDLDI